MRILISGGDGFIGKHLVRKLHSDGESIIVIDNHITSYIENTNLENVTHIEKSIETINLNDYPVVDVIFHMASVASPLVYKDDFKNVYNPNVKGTEKLIELASRDNAKLIYTSTSEVYGMLTDELTSGEGISENSISISHLLTDRSIYPTSKRIGEELIYNYIKSGGNAIILRLFNVYGPSMDVRNNGYGRVIPNFINAVKNNKCLTIFGDGKQVRSFVWIEDMVSALIRVMKSGECPSIINIGNNESHTINELAQLVFEIYGKNTGIEYSRIDVDDPLWRKPNCDLMKTNFSWEPKTTLFEGLRIIIDGKKNE